MMENSKQGNWWLVTGVVLLTVLPLIVVKGEFSGADGEAQELITATQPDYQPWFNPLLEPPSGEIESLLFTSQAAMGAGIMGYVIGLYRGRQEK